LLTNAIKYTPQGGTVDLTIARSATHCEIHVRDNGIGIAPEMLPRIFDLFAQAEGSIDRSNGGMGIGLTLVKRLVELHDGTVDVASPGLGRGADFMVRMPVHAAAQPAAVPLHACDTGAIRVVLVDDNDDVRELGRSVLEGFGCEVEVAADGYDGLAQILRMQPALALVDIGLPGITGYEVATQVRASMGDRVLLVAITGYGQARDRELALAAGFDVHLTKPVRIAAFREMVDNASARAHRAA
ncbi:MAG: hybrid sensor histidine kinase/response regulator, partial [Deltaproteobacteria bacterium]|nr:hybrid sensor histidine kinase/response regulator [Deltaproteobacteria bacterium]